MFGNEEDFSAALGYEIPSADATFSTLDVESYAAMLEAVVGDYPNLKVIATSLRTVKSATVNDWGQMQLQYAPDVARAFIDAARTSPTGPEVFNLGGPVVAMREIVAAIRVEALDAQITFDEIPLPFPARLPEPWFAMPLTPLAQGVRETLDVFARGSAAPATD